jgi:uncharacterized protein YpiB (UPF0302 family)
MGENIEKFQIRSLEFASELAERLIYREILKFDSAELLRFIDLTRKNSDIASIRGMIHEILVAQYASSVSGAIDN